MSDGINTPDRGRRLFERNLPQIEEAIRFISRRNRLRADEAEEFASYAWMRLIENDYEVLRKFEGRSSMPTYLTVVLQRVFLDRRVEEWGKWRPSAEAKRLGRVAVELERLLTRDGYTFDEAVSFLASTPYCTLSRDELYEMSVRFPQRMGRPGRDDVELTPETVVTVADSPESELLRREREGNGRRAWREVERLIRQLPSEEKVILRLRFRDGRKVSTIAKVLGIEQKPLYRRIDSLLADLRHGLQAAGVSEETIREALADDSGSEVFGSWSGEFGESRPSNRMDEVMKERNA